MNEETVAEKALLTIACVRAALKNGCKHYNKNGDLLTTTKQIIQTLRDELNVTVDESERQEVTTPEAELELIEKEMYPRFPSN